MHKNLFLPVGVVIGALGLLFLVAIPVQAVSLPVSLSGVGASNTANSVSNVTWSATLTINSVLSANTDLNFGFSGNVPQEEGFDLSNAVVSITGADGVSANHSTAEFISGDRVNFRLSSDLAVGTKTVTISGVTNAQVAGLFTLGVEIRVPGTEGEGTQVEADSPTAIGAIALMGQVKMPNGTPVDGESGTGVNIRTEDFSQNISTGVGTNGWYAFPVNSHDQGTIQSGVTYFIELWPGNAEGVVSPDPVSFVYNGTTVTKNLTFVAATKTINVTVEYTDGSPVTTADVFANKQDGSGGSGGEVDSNGEKSISVSGGSWDVMVNCGWDQEANQPKDCDWSYNQPPKSVSFADDSTVETKSIVFTVEKTNAKIKGVVYLPDGVTPLPGGFVDIHSGGQRGSGTGIDQHDGTFTANVIAGDYKIMVFPDNMNPDLAMYYSDEISVRVGENETKNLTIVMQSKSSRVSGRVVDRDGNGIAGVWVNAWMRDNPGWGNTQSGADGTFTMYVQPGNWEFSIDQGRRDGNGSAASYIPADPRPVAVSVSDSQHVTGVVLTVQVADAMVNVKLVDSNGSAVSNIFGFAYCRKKSGGFGPGAEFGSGVDRGTASIPLLGGYTYVCGMHMPPEGDKSLDDEVEVSVASGEEKEVRLVLVDNDSAIVGWIKDQNGNVVTGLDADVFSVQVGNWQWKPGKLNREDGSFRISVRGGADRSYMVGIHFFDRESGYMETPPEPDSAFVVPANTEITKIITVFKAYTYISGVVYDPNGSPMPHVWVDADNFKKMEGKMKGDFAGGKLIHAGTETNADGTFRIDIVSGEYTLHSGMPPEFQNDLMSPKEVDVSPTAASPATGVELYYRQADAFVTASLEFEDGSSPDMGFCHAWSEDGGNSGKEAMGGSSRIPLTSGSWWVGCDSFNPETNKFYRSEEQQITVANGDEKMATFVLKLAKFEIPESFTQTFTATQPNVFTLPDGTTVSIPQNAAGTDDSTYTFLATPDTNLRFTDTDKPLTFGWDFSITKQGSGSTETVSTFNSNVTICMPIPKDYLSDLGLTVDDIFSKYWDETSGTWKIPDSVVINEGEGTACLQVNHFTSFALTSGATFGVAASSASGPAYVIATPFGNGGPQVTVWDGNGNAKLNFFAYASDLRIGIQAVEGDFNGDGVNEIAIVPGKGAGPQIRVFDLNGKVINQFWAFASNIRSGIKIAVADVDGDGADEIIATTMSGAGPQIRVFNGAGGVESQFFAYATSFRGGVNLITGDVDGDGTDEIIVAPESVGGPQVRVFNYDGTLVSQFFAYATTVRGGYNLSVADVDGDGTGDIIVAPKAGLGPQVAMFTGYGELIGRFFAYATSFRGGVNISAGDINGDGTLEIVTAPESAGGPQVKVFNTQGNVVSQFWAYASSLRGGFSLMLADIDQDGTADIVTAPGAGLGPQVRGFDYSGNTVAQFFTHNTSFRGGVNISSVPVF